MWGIPLGGPHEAPGAPQGVPRCQRVLKKIAKILNNYIKIVHASKNTPNFKSNTHFRPTGYPGGASGGQNLEMTLPGGYLEDRIWVLWNFCPIFGHLTLFRWSKFEILT